MPTTHLRGQQAVIRSKGVVEIMVNATGVPSDALALTLVSSSGDDLAAHVQQDGRLYRLFPWAGAAVLGVGAPGVFPAATKLGCVLRIQGPDGMVNEVVVPPTDVSALPSVELVRFTDEGDRGWGISAVAAAPVRQAPPSQVPIQGQAGRGGAAEVQPHPVAHVRLPDALGDAARDAARTRLGRVRAIESDRLRMHLIVDISASMLPYYRSGALQGVLSVLAGLNEVHGASDELGVWASSPAMSLNRRQVIGVRSQGLAAELIAVQGVGSSTGVAAAFRDAWTPNAWRVIISDGVPPDLLQEISSVAPAGQPPQLIAFAESEFNFESLRIEAWREQLATARPAVEAGLLRVTSISPIAAAALFSHSVAVTLLSELVSSLVSGLPSGLAV